MVLLMSLEWFCLIAAKSDMHINVIVICRKLQSLVEKLLIAASRATWSHT